MVFRWRPEIILKGPIPNFPFKPRTINGLYILDSYGPALEIDRYDIFPDQRMAPAVQPAPTDNTGVEIGLLQAV